MRYLFMLLLLASGVALAGSSEEIDREFDLKAGGEVSLKNVNGSVTIHGWDKNSVRVLAVKKARGSNAAGKLERTEVRIEATSDRVDIETFRTTKAKKWNNNVSVKYELWVPHQVELTARTTNGNVSVSDISGNLNARSTNGNVTLDGVEGSVNAHTTNGNVTASLLAYNGGEMDLHSTNGSIKFTGPSDLAVNLEAKTTNGSVKTDYPVTVSGKQGRNRLNGTINGGGDLLRLKTTNGSVRISSN